MADEKKYKIEFSKREMDLIADSLCYRVRGLKTDTKKTRNLNKESYRVKVKEIYDTEKLIENIYKIDRNFSHYVLLDFDKVK